jgi:hypothetical protein
MHCFDDKNLCVLLTKSEHNRYMSQSEDFTLEADDGMINQTDNALSWEMEEFRKRLSKSYHVVPEEVQPLE